jgi:pimeloyl-[acyl-carrier protein] methyl ester esterase
MKFCFIFCHGFGFDKSFWNNLRPHFAKEYCIYLNLGYFSQEDLSFSIDPSLHFIGVGHSFGFKKLLSLPIIFTKLIGLQGFINFLGSNPTLHIKRQNDLNILKQNFDKSPSLTLQNFYKRCGIPLEKDKLKQINHNKLQTDLKSLSHAESTPLSQPTLIIGAEDDIIVPTELIYDNFNSQPNVHITLLKQGQHSLGYTQTQIIYQMIMNFSKEHH